VIRNLRDVGKSINDILGYRKLNVDFLYRSGSLADFVSIEHLPSVRIVLNLTRGRDPEVFRPLGVQICPGEKMNNYEVVTDLFRDWICRLFGFLCLNRKWPVLLHCNAGKDRTGVAVALLLRNLGIEDEVIIEEYKKSDGSLYPESMLQLLNKTRMLGYLNMSAKQRSDLSSALLVARSK
jgi:hypothetical protein